MRFRGITAVDSEDIDMRAGELHALVGPNAAGKGKVLNLPAGHLLQRVATRSTIVMAEHDVNFVRRIATRVTAFSLGRKIAEGSADEVFAVPEVRQVFLRGAESA